VHQAPPRALAIGGDPGERRSLADLLSAADIELVEACNGGGGLKAFDAEHPDVVVLDLELEDADGFGVLARIRELSDVPVVLVTGAKGGGPDRVRGLQAGADDCLSKPFSKPELLARIEALLRRPRAEASNGTVLNDEFVHIDHLRYQVEVLGVEVALTPTEFRMLTIFVENPERVLGHDQLLGMVWGNKLRERDEVKLYVSYLRRKLGDAARVDPVETVRGVGYRYRPRKTRFIFE
jgi:DNA-binding response OmpR family regulator